MYSLRRPPANLSLIHLLLWPVIFAQLVALKNWVRLHHGRGMPYGFHVSRWGRVTLRYVGAQPFTSYSAAVTHAPTRFDFSLGVALAVPRAQSAGVLRPARACPSMGPLVWPAAACADTS